MNSTASENLKMLFSKMEDFVSTKTVIGDPVVMGDITLIPLVDVSFGMATGVSATKEKEEEPKGKAKDGGAGGMGAKMTPSAVIIINNGSVQLVNVKNQESVNKIIDMIPGILEKFNLGSLFSKKNKEEDAPVVNEYVNP